VTEKIPGIPPTNTTLPVYTTVYTAVHKPCTQTVVYTERIHGRVHGHAHGHLRAVNSRAHGRCTAAYRVRVLQTTTKQLSNRLIVTRNRNNIEIEIFIYVTGPVR